MSLNNLWIVCGLFVVLVGLLAGNVGAEPGLVKEIPDFVFEKDSDWNDAFDILDYFEINGHPSNYYFINDSNNIDGEYIKHKFVIGGRVSFMPAKGFVGSREFELHINNMTSNIFNVTIVENISDDTIISSENIKYGSQDLGFGFYTWILLIVVGILLIVFCIWFFFFKKKASNVEIL